MLLISDTTGNIFAYSILHKKCHAYFNHLSAFFRISWYLLLKSHLKVLSYMSSMAFKMFLNAVLKVGCTSTFDMATCYLVDYNL